MAGSFNHLVGIDDKFTADMLDNMGDAIEALEECWKIIFELADDDKQIIGEVCDKFDFVNPWESEFDES